MVIDGDKLTSGAWSHETTNLIAIGSRISQAWGGGGHQLQTGLR